MELSFTKYSVTDESFLLFTRFNPGDKFCVEKSLDCAAAAEGNLGELLSDRSALNKKKDFTHLNQSGSDLQLVSHPSNKKKLKVGIN